jgi:hypothetical protein
VPVTFFLDKAPTYIGLDELRPPHLAKKARRKRKRWSKSRKIRADYVVELHALTGDELEGSVFVVHRRRRQSETQEDADRAFQAFLQAHGGRAAKPTKRRRRKKRSQG